MPPRRDPIFIFPPELTQLIQQQNALMQLLVQNQGNNNNNPPPPPPVDNLTQFLSLNPPVFSSSAEPIVADDWLHRIGRELTTAGCTDAEKVRFAAHQLDGPAASWWENYTATFPMLGNVAEIQNFPTCHQDLSMERPATRGRRVHLHTLVDR